ncbi:MAG: tRNA lysidine(34) synthetase TilS [Thermoanaerobaculales bacterium]
MALIDFPADFAARFPALLGCRVLVALSGGADSVALLHLMTGVELDLEAAHVHHGVRGVEADADASFCGRLCRRLGVPFHLLRLQPKAATPLGREGTWRTLRYEALHDLVRRHGLHAIATAHHRDDVAEGVLVQLLRGGGPRSLAGIASQTPDGVVRPLLAWRRDEIIAWLEEHEISWREDSSNRDPQHLRNRVRLELLPVLEKASPSIRDHLVHLAGTIAEDEEYLAAELARRAQWIDPWEPEGGVHLSVLQALATPLRNRWLHAQAARIGLGRVTRRQLEIFGRLVTGGHPRAVTLGHRWRLRLARGRLWLEPPQQSAPFAIDLELGSTVELPLAGWQVRLREGRSAETDARWHWHPPEGVKLHLRNPFPGDRVVIGGSEMPVAGLLAKFLPRHLRTTWPLFCEDDRIYWIPGVWQDPATTSRKCQVVEVIRK